MFLHNVPRYIIKISNVTNISIALARSVEFGNSFNVEAFDKFAPNLRPHAISKHESQTMRIIFRFGGCIQQVTTHFTDVLCCLTNKITI